MCSVWMSVYFCIEGVLSTWNMLLLYPRVGMIIRRHCLEHACSLEDSRHCLEDARYRGCSVTTCVLSTWEHARYRMCSVYMRRRKI